MSDERILTEIERLGKKMGSLSKAMDILIDLCETRIQKIERTLDRLLEVLKE